MAWQKSVMSVSQQLIDAIRAGGGDSVTTLGEILSPEDNDDGERRAVTDNDIQNALLVAAREGSVVACRLLWGKLSPGGKKRYFVSKTKRTSSDDCPLHEALQYGQLDVVRLFVKEFKFNVNQKDRWDRTPLCSAVHHQQLSRTISAAQHLEMARFLLENGANTNVNPGGTCVPLGIAVNLNNTEVVRLLLVEYQANPYQSRSRQNTNTDIAIENGNAEILRMLLDHGACIGRHLIGTHYGTSLNILFKGQQGLNASRETKLTICRILVEHAKQDRSTAEFMQASFEFAIKHTDNYSCHILLEAGIDPRMSMYCAIRAKHIILCQLLVRDYRVDPFLREESNDNNKTAATSPFLAAAHLQDTAIFEYLLGVWDGRFASTGGKNSDGDYPLHVVCCDARVSLQAIMVLVNRQADALAAVDGEQGRYPFHFAAIWDARLDVIFYLLQHYPDALLSHHGGINAAAAATAAGVPHPSLLAVDETNNNCSSTTTTTGTNDNGPRKKKAKTTR